jgi:hypothetical protein
MNIRVRGHVERGRIGVDTSVDLPDNTEMELIGDETETEDERALREAIEQSDAEIERGEVYPAEDVLAELRLARTGCRATG